MHVYTIPRVSRAYVCLAYVNSVIAMTLCFQCCFEVARRELTFRQVEANWRGLHKIATTMENEGKHSPASGSCSNRTSINSSVGRSWFSDAGIGLVAR
jgi:hypothetical protein